MVKQSKHIFRRTLRALAALAILAAMLMAPQGSASEWEITITDLGTLGGDYSFPYDINEQGQIVGASWIAPWESRAFLWQDGVMTNLGTLGGDFSEAYAINNAGQIAGLSVTASGESHAFVWQDGVMTDLGTLGGDQSTARAINNQGQVAGNSLTDEGEQHAFFWTPQGGMVDLGTLGDPYIGWGERPRSYAMDINNQGQVVGWSPTSPWEESHAFLWTAQDGMVDLGTLGGNESKAWAINDLGQIAGFADTLAGHLHAFRWTPEDGMVDLGTLGGLISGAWAINDLGQVVGGSQTPSEEHHAFLWAPETGMVDLGTRGGTQSDVRDLNDLGQVVGVNYTSLGPRGFLWQEGVMTDLLGLNDPDSDTWAMNNRGQIVGRTATSENRGVLWTVPLVPPAPDDQIQAIIADVLRLADAGSLDPGQAIGLSQTLVNAERALERDNTTGVCSLLQAFIHQVQGQVSAGMLSQGEAQSLLDETQSVIDRSCG